MTTTHPFVVQASRPRVTVAYNCPTPEWALRKLGDFQATGHDSITIPGPDGQPLAEADLRAMVGGRAASSPVAPTPAGSRPISKPACVRPTAGRFDGRGL